jgi:indole-3-glycerol phosphate synthase/phosphoribosylanthranilate isomerase
MVLEAIIKTKREFLKKHIPKDWKSELEHIPKSQKSLEYALKKEQTGFILECKKASPSKGLIRKDFDPVKIAAIYKNFADAVSVITEETYFKGKLDYLKIVSNTVDVPVICKDFILTPFQVEEARKYGADAILLMMSVLNDEDFKSCFNTVNALDMDALVEVRNEKELKRALNLGAKIIGINNRF